MTVRIELEKKRDETIVKCLNYLVYIVGIAYIIFNTFTFVQEWEICILPFLNAVTGLIQ